MIEPADYTTGINITTIIVAVIGAVIASSDATRSEVAVGPVGAPF